MKSCENEVIDMIAKVLENDYPDINITSEYIPVTTEFPMVMIELADSITRWRKQDSSGKESLQRLTFEINVYSNKLTGKKEEANNILDLIDELLISKNFNRILRRPVQNRDDRSIYRITAQYMVEYDGQYFYRR